MAKLSLSLACWDYDRTRAMRDGRVQVDGVDLVYQALEVEETFFRMLRYREFDACEMSFSSYCLSKFRDDPFIAIPVWPSRFFRHSCIYVNANSGIREPKDLIGKRVGNPEYQMTAPAWIRGILSDEYGVPVDSVQYLTGGEEEPGRPEKIALELPPNIKLEPIGPTDTLAQMLVDGKIDALYTARRPSCYGKVPHVKRLFEDYVPVEQAYFAKTKIFPIMHTVVLRRDVYEKNRWLANALYKAFVEAQRITYKDLHNTASLQAMLPWASAEEEAARKLMGDDYWPYGFAANQHVLDTFTRYSFEQGLSKRKLDPQELFAPETLEAFKILMITVAEAQAAIAKIVAATEAAGFVVAIAIVDENTDLVAAYRMDGCRPRWMKVSLRKAHTSCAMDRTTENFGEEIVRRQLQISYYGDPMFTALPGGIPIVGKDGSTIGGIGVTGLTKMRDAELAAAGLPCFAGARSA